MFITTLKRMTQKLFANIAIFHTAWFAKIMEQNAKIVNLAIMSILLMVVLLAPQIVLLAQIKEKHV